MGTCKLAIVTLVRNEKFFLPRWLEYYGRAGADLYVLDHESDDGSTDRLPPEVFKIPVSHPECERAAWMLRTVQDVMRKLLSEGYKRVIYAEVDEFLVPDPSRWEDLKEFLDLTPHTFVGAQGWNVVFRPGDPPLSPEGKLLEGRCWKREPVYDMTLVAAQVPNWKIGRHGLEDRPNDPYVGLRLVHLHYADPGLGWERILARSKDKPFAPDGCGWQNKPASREEFDRIWGEQCRGGEPIPGEWWVV